MLLGLFDFSKPAKRSKKIIIRSAIKLMIFFLLLSIIAGIAMFAIFNLMGYAPIGIVFFLFFLLGGIITAISIRNSTFYKLAILEACQTITSSSHKREYEEYEE